jgi:alpha-L-fucosidase
MHPCPYTFVSFKQGATGPEDFAAPERGAGTLYDLVKNAFGESSALIAQKAWKANENKHNETCNTLQPNAWGYNKADDGKHKNAEQVLALLRDAKSKDMNLLLNTGPLPDGNIYPGDVKTLREV